MSKNLYGSDANQVPTNADLGTMAYQDSDNAVMVNPLFAHDDSQQAKFKRLDGSWSTIEINAGTTTGNSRIAFTDPDTEDQVAQNTADGMIDYEHSGDSLRFYTDQSLAAQFTSSGNLLFPDGQGLDFSSSEGSGASSSILDNYEEGTWTPTVAAGSISGTAPITYTGKYVIIGDMVHLYFKAQNSAGDLQVGSYVQFSGGPVNAQNQGSSTVITEDIDIFARQGFAASSGTQISLSECGSSSGTTTLFVSLTAKIST